MLAEWIKKYNLQIQQLGGDAWSLKKMTAVPAKKQSDGNHANSHLLHGRVLDTKEPPQPILGVTVTVKGASKGATTDADGYFEINATEGDQLVFSYVGYNTKEYTVTSQSGNITVSLAEHAGAMNQVVVTGYSKQKLTSLASSVSTIN